MDFKARDLTAFIFLFGMLYIKTSLRKLNKISESAHQTPYMEKRWCV